MNPQSAGPPISVADVEFIEDAKHKKGLASEEAALRVLQRHLPLMGRVIPGGGVGECDAIAFSDAGLVLVEVKRFGGRIEHVLAAPPTWKIERGARIEEVINPLHRLRARADALHAEIRQHPAWQSLRVLWSAANGGTDKGIPVFEVLCFGPTTTFTDRTTEQDHVLVCSTRTLSAKLTDFLADKPVVTGFSSRALQLGGLWPQEGRLTIRGRKGFVRCRPCPRENTCASFYGSTLIKPGRKADVLQVEYAATGRKARVEARELVFTRQLEHNTTQTFLVPSALLIQWKSGG